MWIRNVAKSQKNEIVGWIKWTQYSHLFKDFQIIKYRFLNNIHLTIQLYTFCTIPQQVKNPL